MRKPRIMSIGQDPPEELQGYGAGELRAELRRREAEERLADLKYAPACLLRGCKGRIVLAMYRPGDFHVECDQGHIIESRSYWTESREQGATLDDGISSE